MRHLRRWVCPCPPSAKGETPTQVQGKTSLCPRLLSGLISTPETKNLLDPPDFCGQTWSEKTARRPAPLCSLPAFGVEPVHHAAPLREALGVVEEVPGPVAQHRPRGSQAASRDKPGRCKPQSRNGSSARITGTERFIKPLGG